MIKTELVVLGAAGLAVLLCALASYGGADKDGNARGGEQRVSIDRVDPYREESNTLSTWISFPFLDSISFYSADKFDMVDDAGRRCKFAGTSVQLIKGGAVVSFSGQVPDANSEVVKLSCELRVNDMALQAKCTFRKRSLEERRKYRTAVLWEYVSSDVRKKAPATQGGQ